MTVSIVEQDTLYTCALACLESFSNDQQLGFTQTTLLQDHPRECFVGRKLGEQDISGALSRSEFEELASKLGLAPWTFRDHRRQVVFAPSYQPHRGGRPRLPPARAPTPPRP